MKCREIWLPHHNYGVYWAIIGFMWLLRGVRGPIRAMCGNIHEMEKGVAASSRGLLGNYWIYVAVRSPVKATCGNVHER